MASFPATIKSFIAKINGGVIEASHVNDLQEEMVAVQTKLGVDSSADTSSVNYQLTNASSVNPGHKHTLAGALTDVEITSPEDGQGLVYETASGKFKNATTSVANADLGVAGITELSVAPVSDPIAVGDNDPRIPTTDEKDAMQGTVGSPSDSNRYVTDNDTGTTANKVLRLDPSGKLPVLDGSQLTNITAGVHSINADENLSTHSTTVMRLYGTSTSTLQQWLTTTLNQTQIAFDTVQMASSGGSSFAVSAPPVGSSSQNVYRYNENKSIRIKLRARILDLIDIKSFGLALTASYTDVYSTHTSTTNGLIRFVWNGSSLYAQNSNGSSNTNTNISTGITGTDWNLYDIVFTPGVDVKFYVNGTLKATHTTNLPTTGTPSVAFGVNTNGRQIQATSPVVSIQN